MPYAANTNVIVGRAPEVHEVPVYSKAGVRLFKEMLPAEHKLWQERHAGRVKLDECSRSAALFPRVFPFLWRLPQPAWR
ncbi:hypothetical protein GCM10009825_22290 [Arthrobacter humicola]|uniref:Uncharacterized protein n=1 Tax=Arthrobacter humicola TaxID=409291 RepID=A0ABP5KVL8_9MICC